MCNKMKKKNGKVGNIIINNLSKITKYDVFENIIMDKKVKLLSIARIVLIAYILRLATF